MNRFKSMFTGTAWEAFWLWVKMALVTIVTLGLGFPWAICAYYRWRTHNTIIDGHRLYFDGHGSRYFWLLIWVGLLQATIIFWPYSQVLLERFVAEHTHMEG